MEVRGEDFIKNLEIEKQKAMLKEQTANLNKQKGQSVVFDSNNTINNKNDDFDNELNDIVLEENTNNKQKYIVLVFALILLFLITLIIIRLISEPSGENTFPDDNFIDNDNKIENIVSNDSNRKIQKDIISKLNVDNMEVIEEQNIINNDIKEEEKKVEDLKSDIFNMQQNKSKIIDKPVSKNDLIVKNEPITQAKETIKKTITRTLIEKRTPKLKVPKEQSLTQRLLNKKTISKKKEIKPNKVKGYYIQVGAFTQKPNNMLITKLDKSKYKYIYHDMLIKGKKYTKVLIGPYSGYSVAKKDLNDIRRVSNNKTAYVARFK